MLNTTNTNTMAETCQYLCTRLQKKHLIAVDPNAFEQIGQGSPAESLFFSCSETPEVQGVPVGLPAAGAGDSSSSDETATLWRTCVSILESLPIDRFRETSWVPQCWQLWSCFSFSSPHLGQIILHLYLRRTRTLDTRILCHILLEFHLHSRVGKIQLRSRASAQVL